MSRTENGESRQRTNCFHCTRKLVMRCVHEQKIVGWVTKLAEFEKEHELHPWQRLAFLISDSQQGTKLRDWRGEDLTHGSKEILTANDTTIVLKIVFEFRHGAIAVTHARAPRTQASGDSCVLTCRTRARAASRGL